MKGHSRPTEDAENTGGRGRTRAAAACRQGRLRWRLPV